MGSKLADLLRVSMRELLPVVAVAAAIFGSLLLARVNDWTYADPRGSLLSAQALLEHGSLDLTPYNDKLTDYHWQLWRTTGGVYYAYPFGTTLLHLPFVWLLNEAGFDLSNQKTESVINRVCAAVSVVAAFLLSYLIGRKYNSRGLSLLLALLLTVSTSLYSTMGLALWNLNYAVVIALAIILLLQSDRAIVRADTGWMIGVLCFVGFAVRPSFALFIITTFGFLAIHRPGHLLRAGFLSACLLGLYILFSYNTLGVALPGHYQMADFAAAGDIPANLLGHLFSPSRGLFVFSPVLLITVVCCLLYRAEWRRIALLKYLAVWLMALLLMLSAWFMWWGGGGFGNRLITETMPAWITLGMVFLGNLYRDHRRMVRNVGLTALAVTAGFSAWVHLVQGANNNHTVSWHNRPDKDRNPEYFWSFRFPQFLASGEQLAAMELWHDTRIERRYGRRLREHLVVDPRLSFTGWSNVEGHALPFRWTTATKAVLKISYQPGELKPEKRYTLAIQGHTYLGQRIEVDLNGGASMGIATADKTPDMTYYLGPISPAEDGSFILTFKVSKPRIPAVEEPSRSSDTRPLGFRLNSIAVYERP